ncbi:hypothetical protein B0T10DRAFT_453615 [Thelonectria olida]|uniref:Uncharacterized protein n=1 Tax=Thelonectria olida TaxID=1576542 RepID=A0A9P8WFR7_9HYPO|nr:hypothetical protein B0T10DRAFT_453615 [Thelonectria olida]
MPTNNYTQNRFPSGFLPPDACASRNPRAPDTLRGTMTEISAQPLSKLAICTEEPSADRELQRARASPPRMKVPLLRKQIYNNLESHRLLRLKINLLRLKYPEVVPPSKGNSRMTECLTTRYDNSGKTLESSKTEKLSQSLNSFYETMRLRKARTRDTQTQQYKQSKILESLLISRHDPLPENSIDLPPPPPPWSPFPATASSQETTIAIDTKNNDGNSSLSRKEAGS